MKIAVAMTPLRDIVGQIQADIARANTAALREAVTGLKDELRDQVRRAGLGNRLATTWRGTVYPQSGASIDPAGYVKSLAPNIIAAYADGAVIVPIAGHQYLAVPTRNVPRGSGRGNRPRLTPAEVEVRFDQDLILRRGRGGSILGFVDVLAAKNIKKGGFRAKTRRRLAQGRTSKLVLMFVFVRRVRVAKLLDVQGAAQRWADRAAALAARAQD